MTTLNNRAGLRIRACTGIGLIASGLARPTPSKKKRRAAVPQLLFCPPRKQLSGAFSDLAGRIDDIIAQAQAEGSLKIALSGLNSLRQTLESHARLAGHIGTPGTQVNVAIQNNVNVTQIAERLIGQLDKEPELKARIAQALLQPDDKVTIQVTADQTSSHQQGRHEC